MAWYDNEWGFTHQMIREAQSILGVSDRDAPPAQERQRTGLDLQQATDSKNA
jgi:hypothetical protein